MYPKAKAFADAFQSLDTLELTWLFGMAADQAKVAIEKAEFNHLRHKAMGREGQAVNALQRVPFYQKIIDLRDKWRDAEIEMSTPAIIEALTGRKPKPPTKQV